MQKNRNNKYRNTSKKQEHNNKAPSKQVLEGPIRTTPKGLGFFDWEEREESIRIESEFLNTALNGDIVRVKLLSEKRGEFFGEVDEILIRKKMEFVGTIKDRPGICFVSPQDARMYRDIIIPEDKKAGAKLGQKVLAEIVKWDDPRQDPEGKILRVIGEVGDNDVEMEAIILDKGFEATFPVEVEDEAKRIKQNAPALFESESKIRRDMRDTLTFTIDPADAKDFDDALSFKKLPDGQMEIGIHIADVSAYVTKGSILDEEAVKRATSIYLVDRTIPMLPEILSNDLCSLNAHEDKLAFSAVFTFDSTSVNRSAKPVITKQWFGRTLINSNTRFTYESAQDVLDNKSGDNAEELLLLNSLAKNLRKVRKAEGAISFDTEEVKFELDKAGRPIRAYVKKMVDTNRLIEEFMLLANRSVAKRMTPTKDQEKSPFIYRIHDEPDKDKMRTLVTFLNGLGYNIKIKGKFDATSINAILAQAKNTPEEHIVQTATMRSMAKAIYSTKNIGHFGLGFQYYTHFTSPIRRYPDVIVHRLLAKSLAGKPISQNDLSSYNALALHTSTMEKAATEAERASKKYKQVEYMSTRVGDTFEGTISGVTEWGIFVEERTTKSEGMIRLSNLPDDYYIYDEKNFQVVGRSKKKKYRLGDTVKIKVEGIDVEKRLINYKLA
ncbi:MAG TPA: ribonuclease R [Candidatus Yonathbacteria bacterium]|nr:ribonuclease R [Candidatus Yonathbacteria bacterium]